jgi:hypothetical protein
VTSSLLTFLASGTLALAVLHVALKSHYFLSFFFLSVFFLAYFLLAAARVFSPCLFLGCIQPQVAHIIYPLALAWLLDPYQILADPFSYHIHMLHTLAFPIYVLPFFWQLFLVVLQTAFPCYCLLL